MRNAPLLVFLPLGTWTSIALFACLPLLTSCDTTSGQATETFYSAKTRKTEDRLESVTNPEGFTFLVTCPSGIGGATVSLHGGRWPKDVLVRLRYAEGRPFARVEGFTVANARGKPVEIRTVAFTQDWAEVQLPRDILIRAGDTLTLAWVDMYRQ